MAGCDKNAEDDEARSPASPPCLMHEVDPAYMGLDAPAVDAGTEALSPPAGPAASRDARERRPPADAHNQPRKDGPS